MIVLVTDHIVTLKYSDSHRFKRLAQRMTDSHDQDFVTTAITIEEQMRGWLAQINRLHSVTKQVLAYSELIGLFDFYSHWSVLPFDSQSAVQFDLFRSQRIRIGTMDLKIASIAVTQNSMLLAVASLSSVARADNASLTVRDLQKQADAIEVEKSCIHVLATKVSGVLNLYRAQSTG